MNPFGVFLGAIGGLLFGNKLAKQNLDPEEYSALRVKFLIRSRKFLMGIFAAMFIVVAFIPHAHVMGIAGALMFIYGGWILAPKRIVRAEARRVERERQREDQKAERLARGDFRPEDPEYWRR